jgi:hypothetical protein
MTRRYTRDMLLYEALYAAIVNALLVSVAPLLVFLYAGAVENFPMTRATLLAAVAIVHMVFLVAFFANFFYYAWFVHRRHIWSYLAAVLGTACVGFTLFFSDLSAAFTRLDHAVALVSWVTLLAVILVANRFGFFLRTRDKRYEDEAWLYKHALIHGADDRRDDTVTIQDVYTPHRYINHRDENAPDAPRLVVHADNDPKRAARPVPLDHSGASP